MVVRPPVAPLGLTPFWGFTHGSAFGSTAGYFLGGPSGLGFVGFSGLCRAEGVSVDMDVGPAGRELRASGHETCLALGVGKAADPKTGVRATVVGVGFVHADDGSLQRVAGASAFRPSPEVAHSATRHTTGVRHKRKELRRLSLALLVRPQWFHLNRAEGES